MKQIELEEVIRDIYKRRDDISVTAEINRRLPTYNLKTVFNIARRLGLAESKYKWAEEDVRVLKRAYADGGLDAAVRFFPMRSKKQIKDKAWKCGFTEPREPMRSVKCNACGKVFKVWVCRIESRSHIFCSKACEAQYRTRKFDIKDLKEYYYLLGVVLGDGYNHKHKVSIAVNFTFKDYQEELIGIIKRVFNYEARVIKHTTPSRNPKREGEVNQCGYVNIHSKYISERYFRCFKIKHTWLNLDKIPKEYFYDFLSGVIDTDGTLNCSQRYKRLGIDQLIKENLLYLKEGLEKRGIVGTYLTKGASRACWRLQIARKDILKKLLPKLRLRLGYKAERAEKMLEWAKEPGRSQCAVQ